MIEILIAYGLLSRTHTREEAEIALLLYWREGV